MCENEAKLGWKIVEVSRKEVPAQKASIAVPLSCFAIIWSSNQDAEMVTQGKLNLGLTASATERLVPSRATIRVITQSVRKAT